MRLLQTEPNYECMRRMLMLTDTCIEALVHIKSSIRAGEGASARLMSDVLDACMSIGEAIPGVASELHDNSLIDQAVFAFSELPDAIFMLSEGDDRALADLLEWTLMPAFSMLRNEMSSGFAPYILS